MTDPTIRTGRRYAEARMVDLCTITRVTGRILNEETLDYTDTIVTVYQGRCRVKYSSNRVRDKDAEGQLIGAQQLQLELPADTSGIAVGDIADITTQQLKVRIAGLFAQTWRTALRFPVESLQ